MLSNTFMYNLMKFIKNVFVLLLPIQLNQFYIEKSTTVLYFIIGRAFDDV